MSLVIRIRGRGLGAKVRFPLQGVQREKERSTPSPAKKQCATSIKATRNFFSRNESSLYQCREFIAAPRGKPLESTPAPPSPHPALRKTLQDQTREFCPTGATRVYPRYYRGLRLNLPICPDLAPDQIPRNHPSLGRAPVPSLIVTFRFRVIAEETAGVPLKTSGLRCPISDAKLPPTMARRFPGREEQDAEKEGRPTVRRQLTLGGKEGRTSGVAVANPVGVMRCHTLVRSFARRSRSVAPLGGHGGLLLGTVCQSHTHSLCLG